MERLLRHWRYLLGAVILLSLVAAATDAFHRTPWSDEGWFSSASYNLARHGFLGTTVIETAGSGLTRIDQRTYWVMPLFLLGQALWLKLVPATLFTARLFTLFWHPVALLSLYVFLARLFPSARAVPALAAGLLACSFHFIDNAAFARPDLACAALGLAALASYVHFRERSLPLAMLVANACIAASGMMHPNGIFHALALATLMLWFDGRRMWRWPVILSAAAPYLVTAAAWGFYISLDYEAFYQQMHTNGTTSRWTQTLNPLAIIWAEIRERYLVAFGLITRGTSVLKGVTLLAYVGAVAGCLTNRRLRSQAPVRLLLVLLAVYFAGMSVFNQKLSYYLIHIIPVYASLLAVWVADGWEQNPRFRPAFAAGLVLLAGLDTGGIFLKAYTRSYRAEQLAMVEFVRANTGPESRIAGSAALLYSFDFDTRLKDDLYIGLRGSPQPDVLIVESLYRDAYEAWKTERPADMKRIFGRLEGYRLAYRKAEYEVYLRRKEGQ